MTQVDRQTKVKDVTKTRVRSRIGKVQEVDRGLLYRTTTSGVPKQHIELE